MKKAYEKTLRAEFARRLKKEAPEFELTAIYSDYAFRAHSVFRWVPCEPFHAFVILVPDHLSSTEFVVEVGWSRLGRFPELPLRPSMEKPKRGTELELPEYICRIGWLYAEKDAWWRLAEGLKPAVRDAVDRVVAHGVPYLRDGAQRVCAGAAVL